VIYTIMISAIAVFFGEVRGTVRFTEVKEGVRIDVDIHGLKKGAHGFHVHECGDMSDRCESMCAHFNPYGMEHGGPGDKVRHVGDLGNIIADSKGVVRTSFVDNVIRLRGTKANIIGRGLIIHADEDDLGKGGQADSLTTGHAGKRVACAVIGYAKRP
jgi:Cu-Zn family superoxide dismutase